MNSQLLRSLMDCVQCAGITLTGLLVRVPLADVPFLHAEQVILICSDCGARYVRPNVHL